MQTLTCVHTALRGSSVSNRIEFAELLVDAFLLPTDSAALTRAARLGSRRLIDRVAQSERNDTTACLQLSRCYNVALVDSIRAGDIPLAQYIVSAFPMLCITSAVAVAAGAGQTRFLAWIRVHGFPACWGTRQATLKAVRSGDLITLEWLRVNVGIYSGYELLWNGARQDLDVLQWVLACTNLRPDDRALYSACAAGRLPNVVLLAQYLPNIPVECADYASRAGHLHIIVWLHANGGDFHPETMNAAAEAGHFEIVQWLHRHRSEGCTQYTMDIAARRGYIGLLRWLYHHRHEGCSNAAMQLAIIGNHFEVVQWLHQNIIRN